MGIIDKEVEIKISGNNIHYYERLGYKIPKYWNKKHKKFTVKNGTKIMVSVNDLSPKSEYSFNVQCDRCGIVYSMTKHTYTLTKRDNGIFCHKCAMHIKNSGTNNYLYNESISDEERIVKRNYKEYTDFVKIVLQRDNYKCRCCNSTVSNNFEIHHLNGYNWDKNGRVDPNNGITLCKNCHKNFHIKYGTGDNTKEQFEEWYGKTLSNNDHDIKDLPIARKVYLYELQMVFDSCKEIAKFLDCKNDSHINSICNHKKSKNKEGKEYIRRKIIKGYHCFWYDEYLEMSKDELEEYLTPIKCEAQKVIDIKNKIIYLSVRKLAKALGRDPRTIRKMIENNDSQFMFLEKYTGDISECKYY